MHRSHSRSTERGTQNNKSDSNWPFAFTTGMRRVAKKMRNKKRRQYKHDLPSI